MSEIQIKNFSLPFFEENQNTKKQKDNQSLLRQSEKNQQKNQFLDDVFYYQKCPHCQRKFFQGKLKYHLKLCKSQNPMIKSPLKKHKRGFISSAAQAFVQKQIQNKNQTQDGRFSSPMNKNADFVNNKTYQRCEKCKVKFPSFLIEKHQLKCLSNIKNSQNPQKIQIKAQTKINFKLSQELALPRIQNSAKQRIFSQKRKIISDVSQLGQYTIKIRQDLSCFTKAKQVQKVECSFCGRKFSKQASLRHIPICQNIKNKQQKSIALKLRSQTKRQSKFDLQSESIFKNKKSKQISEDVNKDKDIQKDKEIKKKNMIYTKEKKTFF